MATTADDVWALLEQLIASQKETDRRMQETDRQIQETARQIKAVNIELGELGNRLGEFGSWQVRPAAVKLFRGRVREPKPKA